MLNGIKQKVLIKPGGVIELHSLELIPGREAEVIVIMNDKTENDSSKLVNTIGGAKGAFKNPEEVDNFIRGERNRWI